MIPFILKSNSVSLFPPGADPILIDASHLNFKAVVEAISAGNFDAALDLASVPTYVAKVSGGNVTVTPDGVTYKGQPLTGYLMSKMVSFLNAGLPVEHYCRFLDNLMANPSMVSRNELYLFLEAADLPITPDGHFLAYKAVSGDFKDKHTGTFDNSPGMGHAMPRSQVNDDRTQTCSYGFHAAAYEYARNFMSSGDRLVAVKINPADVVSVPSDYANQKLRCSCYLVMFEVPGAADVFKGKDIYEDAGAPSDKDDYLFWGEGSED